MRAFPLIVLWLVATACSSSTAVTCDQTVIHALSVTVHDALTGQFIGAQSTVIATPANGLPDTVVAPASNSNSTPILVGSTPGTYHLTVSRLGYMDFNRSGIVVAQDASGCHPVTTNVSASLQPFP